MHDPTAEGNDFFKCDFCRSPWAEDRPMIEGHMGALICSKCLSAAYVEVIYSKHGVTGLRGPLMEKPAPGPACTMCRERRPELYWQSPLVEEALCCRRCIRQSATALESDPDFGYTRPAAPAGFMHDPADARSDAEDDE